MPNKISVHNNTFNYTFIHKNFNHPGISLPILKSYACFKSILSTEFN